jgi:Zn-finger nucleic acid-binding protein
MADWIKDGNPRPCPACKTATTLKPSEGHAADFWGCPSCAGVFIAREELYHYVESVTQSRSAAMEFWSLLKEAVAEDEPDGSNLRACPLCSLPLERFGYGEHPMLIADRCPKEHGLWLDDGDLEKVVRGARALAAVGRQNIVEEGPGELRSFQSNPEDPLVCPNCQRRYPESDADTRCDDCNVGLYRA